MWLCARIFGLRSVCLRARACVIVRACVLIHQGSLNCSTVLAPWSAPDVARFESVVQRLWNVAQRSCSNARAHDREKSTRNMYGKSRQMSCRGVRAFLFPMAPSSCWSSLRCSMILTWFGAYGDRCMRRLHPNLQVTERPQIVVVAFRAPFAWRWCIPTARAPLAICYVHFEERKLGKKRKKNVRSCENRDKEIWECLRTSCSIMV